MNLDDKISVRELFNLVYNDTKNSTYDCIMGLQPVPKMIIHPTLQQITLSKLFVTVLGIDQETFNEQVTMLLKLEQL